jgi:hypothetical protein
VVDLDEGLHIIRLEYFEKGLGASVKLRAIAETGPAAPWVGQYYSDPSFAGFPAMTRTDPKVDFEWGYGSPAPGFPADYFSVRWSRTLNVTRPETYVFTTTTDDGVRLYLDGERPDRRLANPGTHGLPGRQDGSRRRALRRGRVLRE